MQTTSRPPSLGDVDKPELVLARLEVPLPETRRDIVMTFESILNQGGVQKVVVEVGKPIQVSKLVNKNGMEAPLEAPEDDFWNQVRNGRMEELEEPGANGYETLFLAFSSLTIRRLKPKIVFCHDFSQLRRWLKLDDIYPVDFLFGIEAVEQIDIPEDAVIVAGTGQDESDPASTVGIRVPVDMAAPVTNIRPLRGQDT
jgi:hypothetical protein